MEVRQNLGAAVASLWPTGDFSLSFFFGLFPFVPRLLETPPRFIRYKNKQTTRFFCVCVFRLIPMPSASESLICCRADTASLKMYVFVKKSAFRA